MQQRRLAPNTWFWTSASISALAWSLIAILYASLGPARFVPRIFFSYRLEHFAAFYLLTVFAAAGLPRMKLTHLGLGLVSLAVVLEMVRTLMPVHQLSSARDLLADVAGVTAALLPILVGRLRRMAAGTPERAKD